MSIHPYRRGSIFWALVLIAVGAIFLYHNFNPAVRPWQLIGKYWPVLIIFWGISKLINHLEARLHPDAVAAPLFTASEVVLLIFLLIVGTLLSKITLRTWPEWASHFGDHIDDEGIANLFLDSFTYTETLSQPARARPRLLIVQWRGDVELRGSNQTTLDALVKKTIRAENEDEAKKLADRLKIEFVEEAGRTVLRTNLDSLPNGGQRVRLDLSLHAPKQTSAEITAERGDIVLDNLQGDQTLTTTRGDAHVTSVEGLVRLHKSGGDTEVREVKGNVQVDGRGDDLDVADVTGSVTVNGDFSGDAQFRNVAQALRFTSSRADLTAQRLTGRMNLEVGSLDANGIEGPFQISAREEDIALRDFKHTVKISDTNGNIRLETSSAPTHPIDVDLKKGDIELALPPSCNFQIEAKSRHGEVECAFPGLNVNNQGDVPSITGGYGKGGPTIHLATAYGTIRLTRQGAHPAAPASQGGEDEKEAAWLGCHVRRIHAAARCGYDPTRFRPWKWDGCTWRSLAVFLPKLRRFCGNF